MLVAGLGLELGGAAASDGQVLERGVPQLMQRPALLVRIEGGGRLLEQVLGARVGQPAPPGDGADVRGGRGAAPGEEQRSRGAAAQQAGQEACGAGGPVDVLDRAALGDDAGAPELQIEVLDVEGEDPLGGSNRIE